MRASKTLIPCYLVLIYVQICHGELKLIQVVFRHGDRAPSSQFRYYYPSDPYVNETWHPEGWGGLNNDGKMRAYDLGVFLKERYGEWLGDVYLKDEVEFRSSNRDRTIMTAQLVATALFPPSEIQKWHPDLAWQPIPVFSDPSLSKTFYNSRSKCPRLIAMREELTKTDKHLLKRDEQLNEFYRFLSTKVGSDVGQYQSWIIHDQLTAESGENIGLPDWAVEILREGTLEEIAGYDYVIQSYNKSMIQLNGGQWIREWLEHVDSYLSESPPRLGPKAFFYSAHEYNVAGILSALGVFEPHVPAFCNAVMLELAKIQDNFCVKVLYKNKDIVQQLVVPGCNEVNCPLEKFRKLMEDVIIDKDVKAACAV
ncbi:venom acid phosphatase Acph-1-like [Athalia rosae]|uniref:venom acid phosphatase Acph-1-like n=1 Tax=Athalia rosae TaxID=37344 RepID=UPI002033608E|nr:venom acid phosphatase Acph-1-like [Athalia rosae]